MGELISGIFPDRKLRQELKEPLQQFQVLDTAAKLRAWLARDCAQSHKRVLAACGPDALVTMLEGALAEAKYQALMHSAGQA